MKKLIIFVLALTLILPLASCSKEASRDFYEEYSNTAQGSIVTDTTNGKESATEDLSVEAGVAEGRKIIRNFDYSVETKSFDALLDSIKSKVDSLGGYVEASNVDGNRYEQNRNRYASMTLRIPAAKSGDFSAFLAKSGVVVSEGVRTEDVTKNYVDTESRLSALRSEKEALEEILKKAVSVEEIIAIRTQLTEVIYQIESYESNLRNYDNLVEYCTVNLSIQEVERTTVVEEQSVWQEIGHNLKNNFENVGDGIVAVFVFFVSAIPYLLIPAAVLVLIIVLVRILSKKKKKR